MPMEPGGSSIARSVRVRFFALLRVLSVADTTRARVARQMEHGINDVLLAIEQYAAATDGDAGENERARAIADQWLGLSRAALSLHADLADLQLVLARHWLLAQVRPSRATDWLRLAGIAARLLAQRENQGGARSPAFDGDEVESVGALARLSTPTLFLTLCGFPRGVSPADAEVELHDGDIIGRAPESAWQLPGEAVSRAHVRLVYDQGRRSFRAIDLSRTGIGFEGGADGDLAPGMLLKIPRRGDYQILVRSVFTPAAAPHPRVEVPAAAHNGIADPNRHTAAPANDPGEAAAAEAAGPMPELGALISNYTHGHADCSQLIESLFARVLH